ncbi:hypothetical protein HaLaN_26977, partial [Haematococcus lacustris]
MRLGNDPDKEDFILLVEDSNRHPALRFLSEYPALVVLAAALLLWAVVKLRRGPSFRGARPSGSSPVPKAVLGGASVDPTRGAQFVHDVRRTQWLEQQQAAYEAQAKHRAEAEEAKRKHAAAAGPAGQGEAGGGPGATAATTVQPPGCQQQLAALFPQRPQPPAGRVTLGPPWQAASAE